MVNTKRYTKLIFICCLFFFLPLFPLFSQLPFSLNNLKKEGVDIIDYADPKEYIIEDISIEGVRYLDETALISLSGLYKGQKLILPGEEISDAMRKLWKKGILGDIKIFISKIEGDRITLKIQLQEQPRLSRIYYFGIPKGQMEDIEKEVKNLQIRGRIVDDILIQKGKRIIENFYREKGFYNVSVDVVQKPDTILTNSIILEVSIKKNKKVKIHSINIDTANKFKIKKLKRKLKKTKEKNFFRIFTPSKFVFEKFNEDKKNLITFYRKNGYRDFRIISDSVYKYKDNLLNIDLKVFEGEQYHYRNISWEGNYKYSDKNLSQVLGIKEGDVYNTEDLNKRLSFNPSGNDVTSLYMDDGYLFFRIEPVEMKVENDSIDLQMRISEGEQANISKVIVNGNTKTNDHVIFREITTLPARKFSRAQIIRTQRELATLSYFEPEEIDIAPQPNFSNSTVDIFYGLKEKSSDQIQLSGGWGGPIGFVGSLGFVFGNFSLKNMFKKGAWAPIPSGDGQKLAINFQASGKQFQTYSLSFTEPWIGGKKPNTFNTNLQYTVRHQLDRSLNSVGSIRIIGFTVGLSRRLQKPDDYFTLSNSISYFRYNLSNYTDFGFIDYRDGISHNVVFNTTFARNSVDNPIFPRYGSMVAFNLFLTPPYSVFSNNQEDFFSNYRYIEYYKWILDNKWYQTIAGNLVFVARGHVGMIQPYTKRKALGPFERFKLGGDGMSQGFNTLIGVDIVGLRGYTNNSIVPLDDTGLEQIGGIAFVKYVLELRYAVSLKPQATVYIHTYLEAGNNWGNIQNFNPFDVYRSAGIGARVFMPVFGMLGFDWGYGFDQIPGSSNAGGSRFHFIIGQQIR